MPNPLPDPYPIQPFTKPAKAVVSVPGSKSITNRALALAALSSSPDNSENQVPLSECLRSRDTEIMVSALQALGVGARRNLLFQNGAGESDEIFVPLWNKTRHLFAVKKASINVGNAGTAARFLTAMLCLEEGGEYTVDGDEAMYKRPMKGLTDALASLGAEFTFHNKPDSKPYSIPFTVKTHGIKGGHVKVDASESSQILSALLIMGAGTEAPLTVELVGKTVSEPFVEMTVEMLREFGVEVQQPSSNVYIISNKHQQGASRYLMGYQYCVEPDATAASYFLAMPIATKGDATVRVFGRCRLQGDVGFTSVIESIGLKCEGVSTEVEARNNLQPLNFRSSLGAISPIGVTADFEAFSDTFLTLAALTPLLSGTTRIEGIGHTRKQETDRVHAMFTELHDKLGQDVIESPDALEIHPDIEAMKKLAREARDRQTATGEGSGCIEIDTYHDHRFAMSFAILGCRDLLGDGKPWLAIRDPGCCKKTFPNFFAVLEDAWKQSHREAV